VERRICLAVLGALFIACDAADDPVAPSVFASELVGDGITAAAVPIFTGQATVIDASVLNIISRLCDAGPMLKLPGGRFEFRLPFAALPDLASARDLDCITAGTGNKAIAEASANDVRLTIGGHSITVDRVSAMVSATCVAGEAPRSQGRGVVLSLFVNGERVPVLDILNQRFDLPNGFIVINEQSSFATPFHAGSTVKALRIVIDRGERTADIAIARTQAHIDCP
jgi:hypothetical protein